MSCYYNAIYDCCGYALETYLRGLFLFYTCLFVHVHAFTVACGNTWVMPYRGSPNRTFYVTAYGSLFVNVKHYLLYIDRFHGGSMQWKWVRSYGQLTNGMCCLLKQSVVLNRSQVVGLRLDMWTFWMWTQISPIVWSYHEIQS